MERNAEKKIVVEKDDVYLKTVTYENPNLIPVLL